MSKGLGQKIVIKFTEDLVGDVSGKPDPILGLGWTRSEFEKTTNTMPRTNGWRFSPIQDIEVTALMIFSDVSTNVTMHLWRVLDQAKLSQITFTSKAGEWASGELSVPIKLIANTEYVVTSNTPINGGYMYSDTSTIDKRGDFSPHITMIDAYRVDSQNTFPTTRLTGSYTNSVGFAYKIEQLGVGNEGAFTITGKEYQYVNGSLIDKEYIVDKVERYPTQRLWGIDESIILEGEGWQEPFNDMNSWDIQYGGNKWSIVDFEGENVLRHYSTAQTRDALRATNLGILMDADIYCDVYITGTGTSGKRPAIATRIGGTAGSETLYTFLARARDNKIQIGKYVNGSFTELAYASYAYKSNAWYTIRALTEGNNLKFKIWERGQPEPSSWNLETTDNSISSGYVGLFDFDGNGNSYFDNFELKGEYVTPKIYTTEAIELSGEVRIRWDEDKPANTNILVEYTSGETQGQWQAVSNGDIIASDTNLWIRATLSTEDTTITPVLKDLWLEEASAPQDKILITMHPQSRFNNVEGLLTVQYDQSKGSLRGRGGIVKGFTETFMPTDLEPKPNPIVTERFIVSPTINIDFLQVVYKDRYGDERFIVEPNCNINLIHTDEINP